MAPNFPLDTASLARSIKLENFGTAMATSNPMIAETTTISIKVNPLDRAKLLFIFVERNMKIRPPTLFDRTTGGQHPSKEFGQERRGEDRAGIRLVSKAIGPSLSNG